MLPAFEEMLAEEVLPAHFVRQNPALSQILPSFCWGDGRYQVDMVVIDSYLGLTLRDHFASDDPDGGVEWIWSHRVDMSDPESLSEMSKWAADRVAEQEAWNAS